MVLSALWSTEGSSKDGDDVGAGIGRSGGVPDGGILNGNGWKVDGVSTLSRIIAAHGGEGIWGSGNDHGESGDGGGVGMDKSQITR
ncbi:hypothetical protein Tco_0150049 [Tanacetum coccineum]